MSNQNNKKKSDKGPQKPNLSQKPQKKGSDQSGEVKDRKKFGSSKPNNQPKQASKKNYRVKQFTLDEEEDTRPQTTVQQPKQHANTQKQKPIYKTKQETHADDADVNYKFLKNYQPQYVPKKEEQPAVHTNFEVKQEKSQEGDQPRENDSRSQNSVSDKPESSQFGDMENTSDDDSSTEDAPTAVTPYKVQTCLMSERKNFKYEYIEEEYPDKSSMIKRHLQTACGKRGVVIAEPRLKIDSSYPIIEIDYAIGRDNLDERHSIDLVELVNKIEQRIGGSANNSGKFHRQKKNFRINKQNQNMNKMGVGELTNFAKQIFHKYYSEVKICEATKQLAVAKAKSTGLRNFKKHEIWFACASFCKDERINLLFVDRDNLAVHLNQYFIKENKESLVEAYRFFTCHLQPVAKKKDNNYNTEENICVGNEEQSSDEEHQIRPENIVPLKQIEHELQKLLSQDLTKFEAKIEEKQEEHERLQSEDDYTNKDKIEKIIEEIQEMDTCLELYKQSREKAEATLKTLAKSLNPQKAIRNTYKQLRVLRRQLESQLPIVSKKRDLFKKLDRNKLIILIGETGSGKSTQLPQMLCEYYKIFENEKAKPILCTQPRKIATRSISERVADELGEKVHDFVDYMSSSTGKCNPSSKIIFMLDRLLLDQLEKDPLLTKYNCLVIDEAHQRTISIDLIIGFVQRVIKERDDFKVIVTSATLDAKLFEKYFKTQTFKVSGRMYPVQMIYKPYHTIQGFAEKIEKCIKEEILDKKKIRDKFRGHILAFCVSVDDITRLCNIFTTYLDSNQFMVCPLHGRLTPQQQKQVFVKTDKTKIIFCTRIAETAVTIDNVKVVIDLGQDREPEYDQKKKITIFSLRPISKSAAKQRAGRAGRTTSGYCFKLYDEEYEAKDMPSNKKAQISKMPLDMLVLRLKQLKVKDVQSFPYLEKPDPNSLEMSLDLMRLMGCLSNDQDATITAVGQELVKLPMEPLLSRAIVQAMIMEKLEPKLSLVSKIVKILCVVANSQGIFFSTEMTREECQKIRFQEFADQSGDFFSLLNVYQTFEDELAKKGGKALFNWCRNKYLNRKALFQARELHKEIEAIMKQSKVDLKNFGTYQQEVAAKINKIGKNPKNLILSCLLSSFCQNLCLYSGNLQVGYTLMWSRMPLQIYGSSFLALQGITPKWVICNDIFQGTTTGNATTYCRVAQAVDFDFLKKSVSASVAVKYNLEECEKQNPFYKRICKQMPTALLNRIIQCKSNPYSNFSVQMSVGSTICINKNLNLLDIYVIDSEYNNTKAKLEEFEAYLRNQLEFKHIHHYMGGVTAELSSGVAVTKLNLENDIYCVQIEKAPYEIIQIIYQYFQSQNNLVQLMQQGRLKINFSKEKHQKEFYDWITSIKKYGMQQENGMLEDMKISKQKAYYARKDKMADICIRLAFFCGEEGRKNNVLVNCDTKDNAEYIKSMLEPWMPGRFNVTKNGISLNYFPDNRRVLGPFEIRPLANYDEEDFLEDVEKCKKDHGLTLNIRSAICFRDLSTQYSLIHEDQWAQIIKQKFHKYNSLLSDNDIDVRGYRKGNGSRNRDNKNKQEQEMFTHIYAKISTSSNTFANHVKKYDKRVGVLGSEKLHVKLEYKRTAIKVMDRVYHIFRGAFQNKKVELEADILGLTIETRIFKRKDFNDILIVCQASSTKDLLRPTLEIRSIFEAFTIPVDEMMSSVLNRRVEMGKRRQYMSKYIFEELEATFFYEVYITYRFKSNVLKVYCPKSDREEFTKKLKEVLASKKTRPESVSYKGKNLNRVLEIIRGMGNKIKYEVLYNRKFVELTGQLNDMKECINKINALVGQQKGDCAICEGVLSSPFMLYNCCHTLCQGCLLEYLRSQSESKNSFPLRCPLEDCLKQINIKDLAQMLDRQQFDKICDFSILSKVDDKIYHGCFTENCEQIFSVEETRKNKNNFTCLVCDVSYCYLCKKPQHQEMTCQQFARYEKEGLSKEELGKMGVKVCRQCKAGIQKDGGCNHISCKCGAHICWVCEQIFQNGKECYDHLGSVHKKIFDDPPR